MDYQLTDKTYICSEPPLLQKIRSTFSSTIIILAAVLGLIGTLTLPVFFKPNELLGSTSNPANIIFLSYFIIFSPNVFLFLSTLLMCFTFKNCRQLSAGSVSLLYLFITLTAVSAFCISVFELTFNEKFSKLLYAFAAALLVTIIFQIVHIIAGKKIKNAIKNNLPKRGFVLASAIIFILTMIFEAAYVVYFFNFKQPLFTPTFKYSNYIGTAIFATLTITSSFIIAIKLISYYISVGRVKKSFEQTAEENL